MLLHNLVIYLIVIAVFDFDPGWIVLTSLFGIVIVGLNGIAFSLFLGLVSARFRDIPQLVMNANQLFFFVTPILFHRQTMPSWLTAFNPFTYLLDVVREPMLGHPVSFFTWASRRGNHGCQPRRIDACLRALSLAHPILAMTVASIELRNVFVRFPIYQGASRSLRYRLMNAGTGGRIANQNHHICIEALSDVFLPARSRRQAGADRP